MLSAKPTPGGAGIFLYGDSRDLQNLWETVHTLARGVPLEGELQAIEDPGRGWVLLQPGLNLVHPGITHAGAALPARRSPAGSRSPAASRGTRPG
jgi:hypothetical protein